MVRSVLKWTLLLLLVACGGADSSDDTDVAADADTETPFHGPVDEWRWTPWCKQITDFEMDGSVDAVQYFERNSYGEATRIDIWESSWEELDYGYDGRRLMEFAKTDQAGLRAHTSWTWNGDLVATSAYDHDADGAIDETGTFEYDDHGRITA